MLIKKYVFLITLILLALNLSAQKNEIENSFYKIIVNIDKGTFSGIRKGDNTTMFKDAWFRLDPGTREWKRPPYDYKCEAVEKVNTDFGVAKKLRVWYLPKESYDPGRFLDLIVPDDKPFVIIEWGVRNPFDYEVRVRIAEVLQNALLFKGRKVDQARVLRGGAGKEPNFVENTWEISALNSAMLTYIDPASGERKTLVAGGLKYREFARRFDSYQEKDKNGNEFPRLTLTVFDPQGKRVSPHSTWKSEDSYYLNFTTRNPFDALEMYGEALAKANNAHPNRYNFPTLCGWMVSTKTLGEGKHINNSPGLVEQMRIAKERGLNKYTKLAVRLEPDYYCYGNQGNTQQGWWDDEHWAKYGSLRPPYETFKKFCNAVHNLGGNVFTYFQTSLPSNDFAVAHPDWMLNDDISLLHVDHAHQWPLVRYDYTNPGFQKYMLSRWKKLADDGVSGIKFDYPETGWARDGGFDDKSFTTTSAYRKVFELCREGMGGDAFIHERNLGESATPRLDVTAGIVDLQRVWSDASHFEPEMASRIGLRWYKQGKAYRYYPDGKSFYYKGKALSQKDRRTFLTLVGLLSGRIELGTSIGSMTDEMFYDLTRMFPTLPDGQAFRPVDFLLDKKHPEVYVYNVNDKRVQVIFVNNDREVSNEISAPVSGDQVETGSLGLDEKKNYLIFDFWNQIPMKTISGSDKLTKLMQPGEALVFSITESSDYPQIVGTNRNVMCGMFETGNVKWDKTGKILSFDADIVGGEEMKVFIHLPEGINTKSITIKAADAKTSYEVKDDYLIAKLLNKKRNTKTKVSISF